jgi:hypothetical protein
MVAIGGIHEHNMHQVLDTGCRFITVVSAFMNASYPFTEYSKLRKISDNVMEAKAWTEAALIDVMCRSKAIAGESLDLFDD